MIGSPLSELLGAGVGVGDAKFLLQTRPPPQALLQCRGGRDPGTSPSRTANCFHMAEARLRRGQIPSSGNRRGADLAQLPPQGKFWLGGKFWHVRSLRVGEGGAARDSSQRDALESAAGGGWTTGSPGPFGRRPLPTE